MSKRDLWLDPPWMNAAGTLGFAPDLRAPVERTGLGAFVTNPLSRRPRRPADPPACLPVEGGVLIHTGLPNPGLSAAIHRYGRRWASIKLPVIVHLMADSPQVTARMVQSLEGRENVMAVELGFPPGAAGVDILAVLRAALGELPLIVQLPGEDLLPLGPDLVAAGAAALSMAAPRGEAGGVRGRIYGPGLFAQTLETTRACAASGLPVIAAGGVYIKENAQALIEAGALAVQLDTVLWKPGGLQ